MLAKRYTIEVDNEEVGWFGDSEEERKEAILMFISYQDDKQYDLIEIIDIKKDVVIGTKLKACNSQ